MDAGIIIVFKGLKGNNRPPIEIHQEGSPLYDIQVLNEITLSYFKFNLPFLIFFFDLLSSGSLVFSKSPERTFKSLEKNMYFNQERKKSI